MRGNPPHTVTEEKVSSQKNDILDARRLAKNLENKDYKSCFVKKFKEIFKRNNCKKKAIIAVARKLGLRLRALLINITPYVTGVIE